MRRVLALCAVAGIATSMFAVPASAAVGYYVIRWDNTGICQVWDNGVPTKPWPSDYKAVSKPVKTFDGALAVKAGLMKKGVCKL